MCSTIAFANTTSKRDSCASTNDDGIAERDQGRTELLVGELDIGGTRVHAAECSQAPGAEPCKQTPVAAADLEDTRAERRVCDQSA